MKKSILLGVFIAIAFVVGRELRVRSSSVAASRQSFEALTDDSTDQSADLARLGFLPGQQLVVFVFGGSGCGFCQRADTKTALSSLRSKLREQVDANARFASISVVGVAVDNDLEKGLTYLASIGTDAFDQLSVGSGWQNEHIVRLIQRERLSTAALPLVLIVSRHLAADLEPLTVTYSAEDSLVMVVQGSDAIGHWVARGVPLDSSETQRR